MISEMETNNNNLIQTLIKGRDSTKRLQNMLSQKVDLDGSVSDDLLIDILESFSGSISMVNSSVSGEIYGFPMSPNTGLTSTVDQIIVPEVPTKKKPASAVRERRGSYKRRRTVDSSEKICATIEDGYAWRKYGQKEIHNSKSPRCYFRCTHQKVHGCKALKQVQKLEDESNMYHITYLGKHTCPSFTHREVVLDFNDFKKHQKVSNNPSTITNIHITPSVKQEVESKEQSTDASDIISSANDENLSSSIKWNEVLRGDHEGDSFMMQFDHEDSCASTSSHGYFDIDFINNDDLLISDGLVDYHVFS